MRHSVQQLRRRAPETEIRRFLDKILIENGRLLGQGPPGGDEKDLAREALEAEIGRFSISF